MSVANPSPTETPRAEHAGFGELTLIQDFYAALRRREEWTASGELIAIWAFRRGREYVKIAPERYDVVTKVPNLTTEAANTAQDAPGATGAEIG